MTTPRLQFDPKSWSRLVLASAYTELTARDELRGKKDKAVAVVDPACARPETLPKALALRKDLTPEWHRWMEWMQSRMPSEAAFACLQAFVNGCRHEVTRKQVQGGVCAMGSEGTPCEARVFANRDPMTQRMGRKDTQHVLHPTWIPVFQACMMVGNVREWMDQVVRDALPMDRKQLTRDKLAELVHATQPMRELVASASVVVWEALQYK